jgi:putative serine protease PepD
VTSEWPPQPPEHPQGNQPANPAGAPFIPPPPDHVSKPEQVPPTAPPARPPSTARVYQQPPVATAAWPTSPPTGFESPRETPPRRRPRWVVAVGALVIIAVLFAGIGVGIFVNDDTSLTTSDSAIEPVSNQPESPASTAPAEEIPAEDDAPVGEDEEEPVAAVALAVAPAVVLITTDIGQGSGIVYDESGLILTNAHVVGASTTVGVRLASGVRVEGQVLGADPTTDVAVVNIDAANEFGVAVLAPAATVEVGQLAVAIGSPFGLEQTVTSGIVSAMDRIISNQVDGQDSVVGMIQTDAPINPGNSGGALADRQGRVIGMNTSIRTDGTVAANVGVGFAIPSDTAQLIADRIVAGENLEAGYLGINGQDPALGAPGALVTTVVVGDPADVAGLVVGDLIVGFNGEMIRSMSELAAEVRLQRPGAVVEIDVIRDGTDVAVSVTLGSLG